MSDSPPEVESSGAIRLQKVLATAGLGSRRACEELITSGRVRVDGAPVTTLGTRVDPDAAVILVDGVRVQLAGERVYLALNKPAGVLSAMSDDRGRACVGDLVAGQPQRLFHVGRLDVDTEGLLLLTNDGRLAQRLAHPSFGVPKTYLAEVGGPMPRDLVARLRAGVEVAGRVVEVERAKVRSRSPQRAAVELTIHEGRNRIVRRLFAQLGLPVQRLVRLQVGPIRLGDLAPGTLRPLRPEELGALFDAAEI